MTNELQPSTLRLKPLRPERYGHPWIYNNEIAAPPEPPVDDGAIVDVADHNGKSRGWAFYNSKSKITARLLSAPSDQAVGFDFWRRRIAQAGAFRARFLNPLPPMYRLVYGEADGLPGLIVDKYREWLVVQILSLGMEKQREHVVDALWQAFRPTGIYERSDSPARKLEGMESSGGLLRGSEAPSPLIVEDSGARVYIDLADGAKTGLFLDQRENQIAAARFASGRTVLNCFSYTGLFGLRAALAGAKSVTDVEVSAAFNKINDAQWDGNPAGACAHEIVTGNAFDLLRSKEHEKAHYGMVILDPPAFTKSRGQREGAFRGYNDINRRAIKLVEPGGVLVTCSCSHHVDSAEFRSIVAQAARDAARPLRLLEQRSQPVDHPISIGVPESEYLKCLIFEVG